MKCSPMLPHSKRYCSSAGENKSKRSADASWIRFNWLIFRCLIAHLPIFYPFSSAFPDIPAGPPTLPVWQRRQAEARLVADEAMATAALAGSLQPERLRDPSRPEEGTNGIPHQDDEEEPATPP